MRAYDGRTIGKIRAAMRFSRRKMKRFRDERVAAIKEYVGFHYGEDGARTTVPVPLIALTVKTYLRHLAARRPRASVTTDLPKLKGTALRLRLAMNHLFDEIKLGKTLKRLARDSLLGVGLCKVAMEEHSIEVDGMYYDVGQPFADVVDLDNAVWDMAATSFDECAFIGDRVRYPLQYVLESGFYKNVGALTADNNADTNEEGDARSATISRGPLGDGDAEFEDHVEIWNVYMPRDNVMLAMPVNGDGNVLLNDPVEWTGPENGPYIMQSYGDVPNQVMPLPPVALWRDLHVACNVLYRKLIRQAERQKEVTGYRPEAAAEAADVKDASDGDMIAMQDPSAMNMMTFGGPNQMNAFMATQARDWYSWLAGNLDSLAGLAPQSETLGQDELLAQSSSKTMQDLQERTLDTTHEIMRDLAWHLWYDPAINIPLTYRVPGSDVELKMEFNAEAREGDFLDYNIKIEPYSAQYLSPAQKLQVIRGTWTQDIVPLAPLIQAQGGQLNVQKYLEAVAEISDVSELAELVDFGTPSPRQQVGPIGQAPAMPAQTTRTNVRVNRSAGTRSGTDKVMQQSLLGARSQGTEQGAALSMGAG